MSEDNKLDLDSPEVRDAIQQAVEKATSGLIQNRDTILQEKRELAEKLKQVDLEEYNRLKELADKQKETKLKDNGNFDELLAKRESEIRADFEAKLKDVTMQYETAKTQKDTYEKQLYERTIADVIRNEAAKAGVLPQALDDVIAKGLRTFTLSEEGELEARNSKGELVKDADEFILTPSRFIQQLKRDHSYYWGASEGAGLSGSGSGKRTDLAGKIAEAARSGNMELYRKLRSQQAS